MESYELNSWLTFHVERFPETEVLPWSSWWKKLASVPFGRAKMATRFMADDSSLVPGRPNQHPHAVAQLAKSARVRTRLLKIESVSDYLLMQDRRDKLRARFPEKAKVLAGRNKIPGVVERYQNSQAVVTFDTPIGLSEGRKKTEGVFSLEQLEARS